MNAKVTAILDNSAVSNVADRAEVHRSYIRARKTGAQEALAAAEETGAKDGRRVVHKLLRADVAKMDPAEALDHILSQ